MSAAPLRVLLVDDEPAVTRVLRRMLSGAGLQVSAHLTSEGALEAFASAPDAFDVAVIDRLIPAISGPKLAQLLWQLRPRLPVVFISGDIDRLDLPPGAGPHVRFAKPMRGHELLDAIVHLVSQVRPPSGSVES